MYSRLILAAALVSAVTALAIAGYAQENQQNDPEKEKAAVKVGDKAPDFAWPKPDRAEGSNDAVRLSDLKGEKNLLIAFYPKAFTPGCTKQLCGYRDEFGRFQSNDTEIVAVSTDGQEESDRFRKEHKMPFVVLGDPDHNVIDAYGIPVKEYAGTPIAQRAVVLVDKEGVVRYVDMDYKIGEDEKALFDAIEGLPKAEAQPES